MAEPKNQHYIPQSYLRNFSSEKNGEYYVYVRFREEKFHETNIHNICSQNYFYTIPDLNDTNKNQIEKYYSKNIDSLYPDITGIVCNDKLTKITDDQRKMMMNGVLNLYFRTPIFLRYFELHVKQLERQFDEYFLGKTEKHKIDFFEKIIDFQSVDYKTFKERIKEKGKQLFLSQHIKYFNEFVEYKKDDGIGIAKIEDDSEYITSDNPVVIRNINGDLENIYAKDNIIHLPISKKYLVTITPKAEKSLMGSFSRISASKDDVTGVNFDIEKNSEKWIIGSKDGIHNHLSYVDAIDNTEEGIRFTETITKKGLIMKELSDVLDRNNGILNQEVLAKVIEASRTEIMKDDVNLTRYIKELKSAGFIS